VEWSKIGILPSFRTGCRRELMFILSPRRGNGPTRQGQHRHAEFLGRFETNMQAAVSDENGPRGSAGSQCSESLIGAIVAPCSARKSMPVDLSARAVSLPRASQTALETAWCRRLDEVPAIVVAGDLYRGRGFATARRAAHRAGADMFIVSAGLGLVSAARKIPGYGLTVAGSAGPDAIRGRIVGRFEPASWWRALQDGTYSTGFHQVFRREGLVLIALTHAYADLIVEELASLDDACLERLRIMGVGLTSHLSERVRSASLLPYDNRLDRHLPGVRGDFCQRALSHFVDMLSGHAAAGGRTGDIAGHRALVEAAMGHARTEVPPRRSRASDADISQRIAVRMSTDSRRLPGVAVLLRKIREEDGIACEASRFSRLYRLAAEIASEGGRQG